MTDEIRPATPAVRVRRRTVRVVISPKSMVIAVLVVTASWVLIRLVPAIMVLLVALMIVGTLNPAVRWLQARGIGRNRIVAHRPRVLSVTAADAQRCEQPERSLNSRGARRHPCAEDYHDLDPYGGDLPGSAS